ncbi:MAG: flagellar hook-basal body complex protein FliE [Tissierella sp.]|nr:flagellar hook-basal body complex protein FliE [Tissierella sp.]
MNINSVSNLMSANLNKIEEKEVVEQGSFNFKDMFNDALNKVNDQQIKADELTMDFITGNVDDLHTVLIATEEARLTMELAVQVRNKCVEAYKEINNMQL